MKNVPAIVSVLYAHQKAEKLSPLEKSLTKALADFFKQHVNQGVSVFYGRVGDRDFFEETLSSLSPADLKSVLKEVDPAFIRPKISVSEIKKRIMECVVEKKPITDNLDAKAKQNLKSIKECKTLEELRRNYKHAGDIIFKESVKIMPSKSLRPFAKRFDKYNLKLIDADDSTLWQEMEALAAGLRDPEVKPKGIPRAAAKAKWSGKEPD